MLAVAVVVFIKLVAIIPVQVVQGAVVLEAQRMAVRALLELQILAVAVAVVPALQVEAITAELVVLASLSFATLIHMTPQRLLLAPPQSQLLAVIVSTSGQALGQLRSKSWQHNSHPKQTLTVCGL